MFKLRRTKYTVASNLLSRVVLWCGLLAGSAAYGQEQPRQPEKLAYGADKANVPDAISKLQSGEFGAIHVDLVARANAIEAIPILKQQFNRVQDQTLKAKIAAALVRMGEKDPAFWEFLVEFAKPAIDSNVPDYAGYDARGKAVSGPSPQFQAWATAHKLGPSTSPLGASPAGVISLGWSGDKRAVPLLRKALLSPNHIIEAFAALGLAEIGDEASIPLIIEACKRAPAEPAAAIAESLVYFDDPTAQGAVDRFMPKERAKIAREAKAQGNSKPLSPPLRDSDN